MEANIKQQYKIGSVIEILKDQKKQIIDPKNDWIYLNRMWASPTSRLVFYKVFSNFASPIIKKEQAKGQNVVLVIPEGLSSSFGIMPFGVMLANELEAEFAIWKEWGDELRARPLFFPDSKFLPRNAKLIILADVVGNGIIVRKISKFLDRGAVISNFITAIQLLEKQESLDLNITHVQEEQNSQIKFEAMLIREGKNFSQPEKRETPKQVIQSPA